MSDLLATRALGRLFRNRATTDDGRLRVVVILVQGIGDLVIWRGALERMRSAYSPDRYELTLVCMDSALEFARDYLAADQCVPVNRHLFRTSPRYRMGLMLLMARRHFTVAIQPSLNRHFLVEDALIRATRAAERIGGGGTAVFLTRREKARSDRWYSRIIDTAPQAMHDLDRSAEFLRGLGLDAPSLPLARLPPPRRPTLEPGYVVVNVSSSSSLKTWPLRRFEEVAHEIVARTGLRVVFCGDAAHRDVASRFALWRAGDFVDRVGDTTLGEFLSLIAGSALVISSDSGSIHLALALRRASLAVLGGGLVGRYLPYPQTALQDDEDASVLPVAVSVERPCFGCGWHCTQSPRPNAPADCIEGVTARAVAHRVVRMLTQPASTLARVGGAT